MLEFLKERYPDRRVQIFGDYAYILPDNSDDREEAIRIYYDPDMDPYILCYKTQHVHLDSEEELTACIDRYLSSRQVAYELYNPDGSPCGGGEMSADKIVDVPLEALRETRGNSLFLNVRSGMTVTVRAWNRDLDRDGKIFRGEDGRLAIHWTKPE
ncbi:MAG: hypothetical protein IJO98_01620 [Clostridia bacterium]|nr:hypothetical protein [Clostridia bacterium]